MATFTLTKPITLDSGEKISEIELREDVTMGDIEKAAETKNEVGQALALVCRLSVTPLTPADVRKISPKDYMRDFQPFVISFLD